MQNSQYFQQKYRQQISHEQPIPLVLKSAPFDALLRSTRPNHDYLVREKWLIARNDSESRVVFGRSTADAWGPSSQFRYSKNQLHPMLCCRVQSQKKATATILYHHFPIYAMIYQIDPLKLALTVGGARRPCKRSGEEAEVTVLNEQTNTDRRPDSTANPA